MTVNNSPKGIQMPAKLPDAERKKRAAARVAAWRKKNPEKVAAYNAKYTADRKVKQAAA